MDSALSASYETCRRLHRRHDPTYYWATRRLPADIRPATHALYGYVRIADEIVDGPRRAATPDARRAELDAWEAALDRGLEDGGSSHPVVGALVDAGARHRLPLGELKAYMGSMRRDCAPVRMLTWEELCAYMDGSAGSVGRIMAPLLGVPPRYHADYGRLGLAFQLTNFLRDVREDLGLERVYLPAEDRERFGVAEADLARPRASAAVRALVGFEAGRARALFAGRGGRGRGRAGLGPDRRAAGVRRVPARARPRRAHRRAAAADRPARLDAARRGRGGFAAVTRRATLRGAERTPLRERADVLVCGASFAGLAVARELAGAGADVLVVDRYEIGERATSACAAPTPWLEAMGVRAAIRQEIPCMAFHTPHGSVRHRLPWSWSSFDYPTLCEELWGQCGDARFEIATVQTRTHDGVLSDRGAVRAPLVVDALGWRRVLGAGPVVQPPEAAISRGLEVHPDGSGADLDVWIDRSLVRYGYAWSVPARDHLRVGVGSYEPRHGVKEPTRDIAGRLGVETVRYQGNWFPHRLRPAVEDGVFFAGDSAGHCFPLSGEGIRTAFYFGIACGRELRAVLAGERTRERGARALRRVLGRPRAPVRPRARAPTPGPAPAAARADQRAGVHGPRARVPARVHVVPRSGAPGRSGEGQTYPSYPIGQACAEKPCIACTSARTRPAIRARGAPGGPDPTPSPAAVSRPSYDPRSMEVAYDERGLVPCVIQDWRSGEVLTLAYMNAESLARTRETGELHLFSRSRNELWHKGATSGNTQAVKAIRLDCDGDAVLALVEPAGPACHTGERTCFHNGDTTTRAPHETLPDLERTIAARAVDRPQGSYTAQLLADPPQIGEKVMEEAEEVARAAREETDERVAEEAADVLYHLTVLLRARGLDLADAEAVLDGRRR